MSGFKNAGRAMGAIFSGDAFRQGAMQEEKRLVDLDSARANAQYRMSQIDKNNTDIGLNKAKETELTNSQTFRDNPLNFAPSVAAGSGLEPDKALQFISSLTGMGGPKVKPDMLPDQEKVAGNLLSNLLLSKMANKPMDMDDISKANDRQSRLGMAQASIDTVKTDPLKAIFQLGVGNDQKSSPDLFKGNGAGSVYNTLTGKQLFNPAAVEARNKPIYDPARGVMVDPSAGVATPVMGANGQPIGPKVDEEAKQAKIVERQDKLNLQKETALEKKVTKFSGEIEKTGIPSFESNLSSIESKIAELKAKGKDLPGYGRIDSLRPNFLTGEDSVELRQLIQTLANTVLKERSGAAVTNQEPKRVMTELGQGLFTTEKQLTDGLTNIRRTFNEVKRNTVAGVDDETLSRYVEQGGLQFERGQQKGGVGATGSFGDAPKQSGQAPKPSASGGYLGHSEAEIAATMKQYGKTRDEVLKAIDRKKSTSGAI